MLTREILSKSLFIHKGLSLKLSLHGYYIKVQHNMADCMLIKCYSHLSRINQITCLMEGSSNSPNSTVRSSTQTTSLHTTTTRSQSNNFGFLFDIDGVFTRGKTVLPEALEAFSLLLDKYGKWRVPAVFVTNAGNTLKKSKAEALSEMFKARVDPNQVVMSHSPLSMFTQFHNRHVLVCGQGPVHEIAKNLGFTDVTTIEDLRFQYPHLDVCDHNRRRAPTFAFEKCTKPIEAIVLFGEPVKWESNLQIIIDILLSDGQPYGDPSQLPPCQQLDTFSDDHDLNCSVHHSHGPPYPHMPVLACNMDLMWMAEAPLPRLAHGSFLLCLESLYEKMSGRRLLYTALVGKPSEITYHHAEYRLNQMAQSVCRLDAPVRTIYCIGDNPHTDIYGANLYHRYLASKQAGIGGHIQSSLAMAGNQVVPMNLQQVAEIRSMRDGVPISTVSWGAGAANACRSVLVLTGVFQKKRGLIQDDDVLNGIVSALASEDGFINHNHRDFPDYPELKIPSHVAYNIHDAIRHVYKAERFF